MPKVSIITISTQEQEFAQFQNTLKLQTFQDFELVKVIGEPHPESWREGVSKAKGDILVFLEASATPVTERWLEELVEGLVDEKTIVKGLEITSSPLNPSSLACRRIALIEQPFNESYLWSEDTELFCRLKEAGYQFIQLNCAPVIHLQKPGSKTFIKRAFRYGLYWAKLRHRYTDPVEVQTISLAFKRMLGALLNLLGMGIGFLIYYPERRAHNKGVTVNKLSFR